MAGVVPPANASSTPTSARANVWLRLEMPTVLDAGTGVAQTMTLTATAQGS